MHDPRLGRFFAVNLLSPEYPWYTPYQFSGNKIIRFVELEGLEEANPSFFTETLNKLTFDFYRNRMNEYITKYDIPEENVISLKNDTYIVIRVLENSEVKYSVFRKSKKLKGYLGFTYLPHDQRHDDIDLSLDQFNKTEILGNICVDGPGIGGVSKTTGLVVNGSKSFGQIVGSVNDVRVGIVAWKNELAVGKLIANSGSKDLLKKGLHFHFKKLGGIELGLTAEKGVLKLKWLNVGSERDIKKAIETFNGSMLNPQFRAVLNANVKAAQETLKDSIRFLKGNDLENAIKVQNELGEISKILNKL